MKYLLLGTLCALMGCAPVPMGQRNVGAAMPFIVVHPNHINNGLPIGYYVGGYYDGTQLKLSSDAPDCVTVHEFAHYVDHIGSIDKALDGITPKLYLQPDFKKRLDLIRYCCYEAKGLGGKPLDLWRVIYRRWGEFGVNHPEILEQIR